MHKHSHSSLFPSLVEKTEAIFNPQMCLIESRIGSYKDWPKGDIQRPEDLSKAGFYYDGGGSSSGDGSDNVTCFHCGIGIYNWLPEDDPWIEHAIHSGDCAFLRLFKPKLKLVLDDGDTKPSYERSQFIKICNSSEDKENKTNSQALQLLSSIMDSSLCKICKDGESQYMFTPCCHLCSCLNCSVTQDSCPICRTVIKGITKVFK